MKKIFVIISLFVLINSCVKDDICVETTTPYLGIYFYSKSTSKATRIGNFTVYVNNDSVTTYTTGVSSVGINLYDYNTEQITVSIESTTNTARRDDMILQMTRKQVFASKACGAKEVYNDLQIVNSTLNFNDSISLEVNEIIDEQKENIRLYR